MAEKEKRKRFTRKKTGKNKDISSEIHEVSSDIVEIERNLIENFIFYLRKWIKTNVRVVRYLLILVISSAVLMFLGVFLYSAVKEKHSREFFSLFKEYKKTTEMPLGAEKNKAFENIAESSLKLCQTGIKTSYSNNACLISSLSHKNIDKVSESINLLKQYSDKNNTEGLIVYTNMIMAAIYSEKYDIEKSIELFQNILPNLKTYESEDIVLYDLGRMYYYKNDINQAKENFQKIIKDHPQSVMIKNAKEYLTLIALNEFENKKGR
ncbi:MAG: tetratricopeptide repeat protein [Spirochaetia bacterium]|nr:tetratricopeptide repeat protein [Spirochaetia bacterium]